MTTTPNPTAAGLVYRVLKGTPGAVQKTDEVIAALRAAGLLGGDPSEVTSSTSDGHHTFDELYAYRMAYHAHAAVGWIAAGIPVVKSRRHSDGELCFGGGWFIVVADLPTGQVSNHYREEYWDLFQVPSADPPEYDGHTPDDALQRLLAAAAGVAPQDELPVASALPVGDDSGHAGGDDRGSREDGPEEEGCSHRTTVAGAPQEPAEASFTERRRLAEYAWAGYRAVAGGPEAVPAWFGAGFTLGMNAERSRAGVAPQEPSEELVQGDAKLPENYAPPLDREKLIAEAERRLRDISGLDSGRRVRIDALVARNLVKLIGDMAAALAVPVEVDEAKLDPEKVAEVINRALDRWEGNESSEVFVAQAICEAEVEGRLRGGGR